jgi:hypothetical protein
MGMSTIGMVVSLQVATPDDGLGELEKQAKKGLARPSAVWYSFMY